MVNASWASRITGSSARDGPSGIRTAARTINRMARLIKKLTKFAITPAIESDSIGNDTRATRLALCTKAVGALPTELEKKSQAKRPHRTSAQYGRPGVTTVRRNTLKMMV